MANKPTYKGILKPLESITGGFKPVRGTLPAEQMQLIKNVHIKVADPKAILGGIKSPVSINTDYNSPSFNPQITSLPSVTGGVRPNLSTNQIIKENNNSQNQINMNANPLKSTVDAVKETLASANGSISSAFQRMTVNPNAKLVLYGLLALVLGYVVYKKFFANKRRKSKLV